MPSRGARVAAVVTALTLLAALVALAGSDPATGLDGTRGAADRQADRWWERVRTPPAEPDGLAAGGNDADGERTWRLDVPAWLSSVAIALLVAAAAAAAVVLAGGLGHRARRRGRPAADARSGAAVESDRAATRRAVDAALVPLRDPDDPRAAVIEAYARLEHVLAERDLGRRAPEAPREYLARVLGEQGMPAASLTTLTSLFEQARFGRHPVPDTAPRRARTELERARTALAR